MFEEIDQEKEAIQETRPIFEEDHITNKDIGTRIKLFSRFFFKVQKYFLTIIAVLMLIGIFASLEELDGEIFLGFIIVGATIAVLFVFAYYLFLIVSGFGALVEDVHAIKEAVTKEKKVVKVIKKKNEKEEKM